jgi:tetratricopeptide (TPR) repeat protein
VSSFARLVGFFVLAWVLLAVLQTLPVVGRFFQGLFGFWLVLIALSLFLTRMAQAGRRRAMLESEIRALGNVDSAHNQGKLGSLLLAHGRVKQAVAHLERAAAGEPGRAEWHYRLGQAELLAGRPAAAIAPLERAVEIEEEHAYGGVQLALAEACTALGRFPEALERLRVFERNHGPSPESAYRRGQALKKQGEHRAAKRAFAEVAALARTSARYQRKDHGRWVLRAQLARIF